MAEEIAMKVIARIHTDFPEKFGIPRQSGLIEELKSTIVFEPEFRDANALRGLEEYSHLWLIWEFSEAVRDTWSPMVRPPRLGGNKRVGVFATRSPFRPNPIGLSSVKLEYVEQHPSLGPVLHLTGADLMDGTPILDIKPYLPHVDSHVEALGSFTEKTKEYFIPVEIGKGSGRPPCGAEKSAGAGSASIVSEQRRTRLRTFLCGNGNQIPGKGRGTACCGSRNVRKK